MITWETFAEASKPSLFHVQFLLIVIICAINHEWSNFQTYSWNKLRLQILHESQTINLLKFHLLDIILSDSWVLRDGLSMLTIAVNPYKDRRFRISTVHKLSKDENISHSRTIWMSYSTLSCGLYCTNILSCTLVHTNFYPVLQWKYARTNDMGTFSKIF